jgi:Uma2 family endonuclease
MGYLEGSEECAMSMILRDTSSLPGHMDLPSSDDQPVENSIEQFQNLLLTDSLLAKLNELYPDNRFFIGHDVGIYYDQKDVSSCRAPDWFFVPDTTPYEPNDGGLRRSYVMWREQEKQPYLIIEQVSSKAGVNERNRNPGEKMWVYEQKLQTPYYAIFDGFNKEPGEGKLEVYRLENKKYVAEEPDANGRYLIPALNVLLGIEDEYQHYVSDPRPWLRFYDLNGKLLPTPKEIATDETRRANSEARKAKAEAKARREAEERARIAEEEIAKLRALLDQQKGR